MPEDIDPKPGATEIRVQLARILASPEFVRRQKPAEVLQFLVDAHLEAGKPIEEDIRKKIFPTPPYDPEGTNARNAVSTVRQFIRGFYLGAGREDPVLIELPKKFSPTASRKEKSESYPVVCRYNPRQRDFLPFKLARQAIDSASPHGIQRALETLNPILQNNPEHLEATIAKIECLCLMALCIPATLPRRELHAESITAALRLAEKNPEDWHAHLLLGAALTFVCDWNRATIALLTAMRLDRAMTIRSLWLAAMCIFDGDFKNAVIFTDLIAQERGTDFIAWAAYGFSLYMARDFERALDIFSPIARIQKNFWIPHLGLALVSLAMGDAKGALENCNRASILVGDLHAVLPAVGLHAANIVAKDDPEKELSPLLDAQMRKLLEPADPDKD